jgi:hypothetical protein
MIIYSSFSFIEMKYKALMEGSKEATWSRSLIGELGFLQPIPTPISCDMTIMKITNSMQGLSTLNVTAILFVRKCYLKKLNLSMCPLVIN